ncbi:MAG: inositol monophosphatase family protein, partial [bacterium]|nr:inositol monophosphatase family protein [bacterium]
LYTLFRRGDIYGGDVRLILKEDRTFASSIGLESEEKCLSFLESDFPGMAIVSEETRSGWPPSADRFWLVDPDDGTHNLLSGLPNFGTMLALIENGLVTFTAIFLPFERAFGRSGLYVAGRGAGAWEWGDTPRPLAVSGKRNLTDAFLFVEGPSWRVTTAPFPQLVSSVRRWRINLATCWAGTRLVLGGVLPAGGDLMVSFGNQPWDNLPVALLVEEASGRVSAFDGRPPTIGNCRNLVFSNGFLHDAALAVLGG